MDIEGKKKIFKCYDALVNNITGFELIMKLIESNLLTFEDGEEIRACVTDNGKVRLMLDKLLRKTSFPDGTNPYLIFLHILRETNRNDLANLLQKADISGVTDADMEPSIEDKVNKFIFNLQSPIIIYQNQTKADEHIDQFGHEVFLNIDEKLIDLPKKDLINYVNQMLSREKKSKELNINLRQNDLLSSGEDVLDKGITMNLNNMNFVYSSSIQAIACELGEYILTMDNGYIQNDLLFKKFEREVLDVIYCHSKDLNSSIAKLHITELQTGYPAVSKIADELFIDKNWGRIITWYAFWRHLVINIPGYDGSDKKNICRQLGNYIGFILASRCEKWIRHHGGWTSYFKKDSSTCILQ